MSIISIWARDFYDNTIAIDGKIPWHVPSDLKRFKSITDKSIVVMGRKTYETLPNRDLPDRLLVVLSKDSEYQLSNTDRHFLVNSLDNLHSLKVGKDWGDNLYVVGGSSIYAQFFNHKNLKPDYVVDCRIRDIQLKKKLDIYPKERKTFLDKETDIILKKDYVVIKSSSTKDNFVNTLYFKKDLTMNTLMERICKNF